MPRVKRLPANDQFWRDLKIAFREAHARAGYSSLRGRWNSIYGTYSLLGSEEAQSCFKALAEAAARDLPKRKGVEPWQLWLGELVRREINCSERLHTIQLSQKNLKHSGRGDMLPILKGREKKGTKIRVFKGKSVTVDELLDASAMLGGIFESTAEPAPATAHTAAIPSINDQQRQWRTGERRQRLVRRSQKYKAIDVALQEAAESRPKTQEEIFRLLEARQVVIPAAEPFASARGWVEGFHRDPAAARAWLSKRWAALDLPPLPRGPKSAKK
jgi:hypothetical protein